MDKKSKPILECNECRDPPAGECGDSDSACGCECHDYGSWCNPIEVNTDDTSYDGDFYGFDEEIEDSVEFYDSDE